MSNQDADESFFESVRFETGADSQAEAPPRPTRRNRFRTWRRSRPFWGGLLCILGGLEIGLIPLTAYRIILVSHSVALAAVVGAVIAILGLMLWMTPSHNKLYGLVALLLALVSFVTSNIGGFALGGLLAIFGGALGFAWDVLPEAKTAPTETPLPEAPQP
jgi:drug/metabolite transporter (DMT)-like permease